MTEEELRNAPVRERGHVFEHYEVGQEFVHHWGRTLTEADSTLFSTLTLHFNPTYYNTEYAQALGFERAPVNPLLVFNTIVGLSVEDLSEAGGPFLGIGKLAYGKPVYPGDTLYAKSVVLSKRLASNGMGGPVTWRTIGYNQRGEVVVEFERTNLVRIAGKAA
ncbi:MaoC family dehydratase [Pseudomonas sp. ICMP22404]|uniref:MaoC family dehydratase n=1 Tax=Pseudomonas sp. ICMP22404 TaxID=2583807 RepID=UPI0011196CE6|nr:MaoC family dehydratase [Pseudomonas sp. ICMP22404]TNF83364.1 MaoC family dehydratase [Pseudomonas sp. ICMP22404]